jgi:CRISPR/Cas system-associated endoribonuclease Cas2
MDMLEKEKLSWHRERVLSIISPAKLLWHQKSTTKMDLLEEEALRLDQRRSRVVEIGSHWLVVVEEVVLRLA